MGIREAIEWHAAHTVLESERDQERFDRTIKDVLSILDKHLGELVLEVEIKPNELKLLSFGDWFLKLMRDLKGGDRIAIYKLPRRDKEE